MKKRILLSTVVAAMCYVIFTSESGGPAYSAQGGVAAGGNRTGVRTSTTNCGGSVSGAPSCHGTGTTTSVTITVDSGTTTTATTHYVPGMTYTIKIHGSNSSSLPKYGFEFAAVSGSGTSQVQAGTFSGLGTHIADDTLLGIHYVEHSGTLTGSPAGTYDVSAFVWTAPASNVGNITLYCTLNAVDGNGSANAADISGNTSVVLTPLPRTGVAALSEEISLAICPNPFTNSLNLMLNNAAMGAYNLNVFSLTGALVASKLIEVTAGSQATTISTGNWMPGLYNLVIEKDGITKSMLVVKQ